MKKIKAIIAIITILGFFYTETVEAANTNSGVFANASAQYVYILNDLGITGTNITLEFWMKLTSNPPGGGIWDIMSQSDGGNKVRYRLLYIENSGNYDLQFKRSRNWVNGTAITYSSANFGTTNWVHIAAIYDGANVSLYTAPVGGTHTLRAGPTAASGNGGTNGTDHFSIGTVDDSEGGSFVPNATARRLDAKIDDVRVWNAARTTTELDNNFQTELVGNETNLVAYYKMNNDSWVDTTANAYHLTAVNSPTFNADVPFGALVVTVPPVALPRFWFLY